MAAAKKESRIKSYNELNAAVSRIYHYACGVCNAKTEEEAKELAKELTDTVMDITIFKLNSFKEN